MSETAKRTVSATFLYSGMPDYWHGDGDRWDENKGCLFAYYGPTTTLREMVDEWVDDSRNGDLDDKAAWSDVSDDEIRAALIEMLSPQGRKEYDDETAGPCEFARAYADANGIEGDDDGDSDGESPFAVVLVTVDTSDDAA